MSVQSLGGALGRALYEAVSADSPDFLKGHPGKSFDRLSSAKYRMFTHKAFRGVTLEEFEAHVFPRLRSAFSAAQVLCESPIERDALASLMAGDWHFLDNPFVPVHNIADKTAALPKMPVVMLPQFPVAHYRLDLAICAEVKPGLRKLYAVECDGRDFHDRMADNHRDAVLAALGIRTFRLSGSLLHTAAEEAVDHVIAAIGADFQ